MHEPRTLRYRLEMRKTISKLVLHREIVRMLVDTELVRVLGGVVPDPYPQTGAKQCPAVAITVPPGG